MAWINVGTAGRTFGRVVRNGATVEKIVEFRDATTAERAIEAHVPYALSSFCYPAGLYGPREVEYVRDAGYAAAVTTNPGVNNGGGDLLELRRTLIGLESKGQRFKEPPQRYKGLGEMDAKQLADTTMDPRHRTLRRIRMEDGAAAQGVFNLLMGTDVAPRRDFIIGGAAELDLSRIDT